MKERVINRLNKNFKIAKQYYDEQGTIIVIDADAHKEVCAALASVRSTYAMYEDSFPDDIKAKFDELGMIWDARTAEMVAVASRKDASWDSNYELAKQYYKVFGSLTMPKNFEMYGVKLGEWIEEQKESYAKGEISIDRACRLGDLDINWGYESDHISYDESVIAYYVSQCFPDTISSYCPPELRGKELDVYVPSLKIGIEFDGHFHRKTLQKDLEKNQLCKDGGYKLIRVRPNILPRMRSDDNCTVVTLHGSKTSTASKETAVKKVLKALGVTQAQMPSIDIRRDKHEIMGIVIEDKTYFNQYLMAASKYAHTHGHLLVPHNYTDPTGLRLGKWINSIRYSRQWLTERQVNALDDIGMVWRNIKQEKWLTNFAMARSFGSRIPNYAKTTDGESLKDWYEQQKNDFVSSRMKEDYKLEAMKTVRIRKDKNRSSEER